MRINKRLVLGITIPILILGLGLFLVFAIFKTARVYLMIAPENATITINGKKYKNGEHKLFPGKKTVRVSGEGIEPFEIEIEAKMHESKRVAVYRKVNGSYDSYMNSRSDYLVLKALFSEQDQPDTEAIQFLEKVDKAKGFLAEMPEDFIFANNDGTADKARLSDYSNSKECPAAICILLETDKSHIDELKEMIKGKGYNCDDYYIVERKLND